MKNSRFVLNGLALLIVIIGLSFSAMVQGQGESETPDFYFGVDLSYVNEMDDCGAVYRENGEVRDPFALFADHGANLVRARLWHNPDWTNYSTLDDVKRTFIRAHEAGMNTLLDFHYSDNWADPSTQEIPAAWEDMDDAELAEAVYQYTADVLAELHAADLVPAFVQVGNETNSGMLSRGGDLDWSRNARLFNAGIKAVRDFSAEHELDRPQIILHVAQPENTGWWFTEAETAGITEFDVIGISYYPQWSTFSIADTGAHIGYLRGRFGKDVMVMETAYGWTRDAVDESADNILNQGLRGYPFSPEGQHQFMRDLTQTLISNGALGVVYWEPAWVSTECSTRWGQGSHWENATFFDFQNENEVLLGIDFLRDDYFHPTQLVDGMIEADFGSPLVEDGTADVLENNEALDLQSLHVQADEDAISLALTIAGDVYSERGTYLVYIDTTHDDQGAAVDAGRRPITVADPYKPEYRLDIGIVEERGTYSGTYVWNVWNGTEWEQLTFTGGAIIAAGDTSVIELQIPRALLGSPETLNIAVLSTGRGRVNSASDILGTDIVLADDSEALVLDTFFAYILPD